MTQEMPGWLVPTPQLELLDENHPTRVELRAIAKRERRELDQMVYESIFDSMMDHVAQGNPLTAALENDPREINYQQFLAWVIRDETRKARFYEAQEIGAEVVASQMLQISDASDSLEDVARSTLRITTRKWLLGVWNRKRFGDIKQIDQNVTIDLGAAMAAAQERVANRTVDVQSRIVHDR